MQSGKSAYFFIILARPRGRGYALKRAKRGCFNGLARSREMAWRLPRRAYPPRPPPRAPNRICRSPARERSMNFHNGSRRSLLTGAAATALAAALPGRLAFGATPVVGFIYVGSRDDYGYNQAHAAGAAALKKVPGVKVIEEEKVPETDAVEKTMESMINLDGANFIFPTSYGYYAPHTLKMAAKYPKVRFEHAADCGPRRTRRTSAATSATSTRRSTSPASSPAPRPSPASSASSPPSRSRRCCATSTPSCWARASPIRTPRCR